MKSADLYTSDIHIGGHPSEQEAQWVHEAFEELPGFLARHQLNIRQFILGGDIVEHLMGGLVPETEGDKTAYERENNKTQVRHIIEKVNAEHLIAFTGNHEIFHVDGQINSVSARTEMTEALDRTQSFYSEITPDDKKLSVHRGFVATEEEVIFHHGHHLDIPDAMHTKLKALQELEGYQNMSQSQKLDWLNEDEELPVALQELWAQYISVLGFIIKHAGLKTYVVLENVIAMIAMIYAWFDKFTSHSKLQLELSKVLDAKLIISGHSHVPGIYQKESKTIASLGSWTFGSANPMCGIHIKESNQFWMIEYRQEKQNWHVAEKVDLDS